MADLGEPGAVGEGAKVHEADLESESSKVCLCISFAVRSLKYNSVENST